MILAVDIGTSSTRAVLYDAQTARAIPGGGHTIAHDPDVTADGGATLDADALVGEAVFCIRTVLDAIGTQTARDIRAVAVCTFWHSCVGVDARGAARTPVLLWSDRRSDEQVARLRREIDAAAYTQRTGCPVHTSYLPGRLRWLADTQPDVYRSCARFLSPGEYLFAQIFGLGRVSCSVSMASASGLMDQTRGAWDDETLAWLPGMTPDRLSPIRDDPLRGFARESRHAAALAPLADVPWFPAVGDGACSNLGCGATDPRRLALMIGTSGALRVVARRGERPPVPGGLWRYQADADRFLVGGALSNGGNVWAWLNETLNLPRAAADAAADEDALAVLPPDGHGLTVLPFLHGERAPGWHDDARAVIAGLSAATTAVEIARAHLEAVAYRFAAIRERLRAVAPSGEIIGTGAGLLASPVWAQILADVLGEPIAVSREEQASSRGAALLARERLGRGNVDDEAEAAAVAIDARYEPDARRGAIYAEARVRHEALYRRVLGAEGPDVPGVS